MHTSTRLVNGRLVNGSACAAAAALAGLAALAAPGATAADISSATDMAATIALNGQPCDRVIDVKRNADSDYIASCKDGNRYHVFVNAQGRVVVQKQ